MRDAASVLVTLLPVLALDASGTDAAAAAEATTGTIAGSVLALDGSAIGGATIVVTAPNDRHATTSDARGHFTILGIDAGTYTVSADARGYQAAAHSNVVVLPGERQRVDFRLAPGHVGIGGVRWRPTRRERCKARSPPSPACSWTPSRTRSCAAARSTTRSSTSIPCRYRRD